MKSYTDIEQSKKLTEILPLESADMIWATDNDIIVVPYDMVTRENVLHDFTPCWSLAALLGILPQGTRLLKSTNISTIGDIKYHCDCSKVNVDKWSDNPVDACYEMIIKLHELNLL